MENQLYFWTLTFSMKKKQGLDCIQLSVKNRNKIHVNYEELNKHFGPSTVRQYAKPPPAVPTLYMGAGTCPGSYPAP